MGQMVKRLMITVSVKEFTYQTYDDTMLDVFLRVENIGV